MKRLRLFILLTLVLLAGKAVKAQPSQAAQSTPNCVLYFSFTAAGQTTPALANYGAGSVNGPNVCDTWALGYSSVGFSAISLVIQNANAATTTTPSTWGTYAGTMDVGVNPNTSTAGAQTKMHNGAVGISWIRVALPSATGSGTVFGVLQGWNAGSGGTTGGGGGGGGGTCPNPCPVEGTASSGSAPSGPPVLGAGSDGTDVRTLSTDTVGRLIDGPFPNTGAITISGSGLTQIIAAGSGITTVGHLSISLSGNSTFQLEYGTGSNCASGTTALSGVYAALSSIVLDKPFVVPSAQALCVNIGSSVTGGGLVTYGQP